MIRFYLSGNEVHDRVIRAMHEGCPESKEIVKGWGYKPSDIAVIFGVHKSKVPLSWPRGEIFRRQREQKLDVVVLETGYINRGDGESHHYAAGFNGLNGRADFKNKGMPSDRWEKLGVELKPYRDGENIVLCAQVPWDASVEGTDHLAWIKSTVRDLKELSKRPIVFRHHPLAPLPLPEGCKPAKKTLLEDLENAHCVVTFNSNSGVEALINGVPVVVKDAGSMLWNLAPISFHVVRTFLPKREQWAYNLAYCQWTPQEMKNGEAWRHLLR